MRVFSQRSIFLPNTFINDLDNKNIVVSLQMIVNIEEHVLVLPVGLNHLIESHNSTKRQTKRAKYSVFHEGSDKTSPIYRVGDLRSERSFPIWEMQCVLFIKDWRELNWLLGIARSKGEISVRAGFWTWASKVQHYLVAGNLKLAKTKLETRDSVLAANITVGIDY